MESHLLTPRRRPQRERSEEDYNRDGRWMRTFTVRTEPWPMFEHWAHEYGFHLTAIKGRKRLYRLGENNSFYNVWLEIKQNELQITVTAWITCGWGIRLLWGLLLPGELVVEPTGWKGARRRRQVCVMLNSLLERFRQGAIAGSRSFHWADIDPTTLLLGLLAVPAVGLFVYLTGSAIVTRPGLTQNLLPTIGRPLGLLALSLSVFLALQHFIIVKRFPALHWKMTGLAAALLCHWALAFFLVSRTSAEIVSARVTFYCVQNYSAVHCQKALSRLSPKERDTVLERLRTLEKELSLTR